MSEDTAEKSLQLMFSSPARNLVLEFQGGEPTLNFPVVRFLAHRARELAEQHRRNLRIVLASNSANLSEERLLFMKDYDVFLSTSLDGPEHLHNSNRPRQAGNCHSITIDGISRAREILGVDRVHALMTTSRASLRYPKEIVDEYLRLGFRSIFLRKLNPYGFALKTQAATGYTTQEFLEFYRIALDYIIEKNLQGIHFEEVLAKIFLTKILTPFPSSFVDIQSPAGAGIKCVIYNYDGRVFASDEARMLAQMGDDSFLLGNVHENSFTEIFAGKAIRAIASSSINQSLPGCSDCAYQAYCGADPVRNYSTQGDVYGHRPTSQFCEANLAIIRLLMSKLEERPEQIEPVFLSWVRQLPLNVCRLPGERGLQ